MLFKAFIEPSCTYCRFGSHLGNNEIACSRCGIVGASGYCAKFRYEPTKRLPEGVPCFDASALSAEDFSLPDAPDDNAFPDTIGNSTPPDASDGDALSDTIGNSTPPDASDDDALSDTIDDSTPPDAPDDNALPDTID